MAFTTLQQKPYTFIDILYADSDKRKPLESHGRLMPERYTGSIDIILEAVTPVHVSGNGYRLNNGEIVKAFVRRNGKPIIPGSSIKGTVRSLAEMASYSCCYLMPKDAEPARSARACDHKQACVACRMFGFAVGAGGYKGRVSFGEFALLDGILKVEKMRGLESPYKHYPRSSRSGNERLYYCQIHVADKTCGGPDGCITCDKNAVWFPYRNRLSTAKPPGKFRGRKLYYTGNSVVTGELPYEIASIGAKFRGKVWFTNLDKEEMKLLAFSLGLSQGMDIRVGYGKPAYFGQVKVKVDSVDTGARLWQKDGGTLLTSDTLVELARQYGANDSRLAENVAKIRQVLSGDMTGPNWQNTMY